MEKLERLLQEMVVQRFGENAWLLILQQSRAGWAFDQQIESYGAQRLAMPDQRAGEAASERKSSPARLLNAAAELMETTVPGVQEELGGYFARSLQKCDFPYCRPDSETNHFSERANKCASCPLRFGMFIPGSLQVNAAAHGGMEIQCSLRENDLWVFLRGFLSETLGGLDELGKETHSETIAPDGKSTHSFVIPKERGMAPGAASHATGAFPFAIRKERGTAQEKRAELLAES